MGQMEFLLEAECRMKKQGISKKLLAQRLGWKPAKVSQLFSGTMRLSSDTIGCIGDILGMGAETLNLSMRKE